MERLVFRKFTPDDEQEIACFKEEFAAAGSGMDGTGILFRSTAQEWLDYVAKMEDGGNSVPCLQFGLFEEETNRLLGTIQIRLRLMGYLVDFGGHIGYCVRPSERRRGFAKEMLRRALPVCREEGIHRVLVTCLEDNTGSAKTIEACGGVFEKLVYDGQNYRANMKRYWISL